MHLTLTTTFLSEVENSAKQTEILIEGDKLHITKIINSKYYTVVKPLEADLSFVEFQNILSNLHKIEDALWIQVAQHSLS